MNSKWFKLTEFHKVGKVWYFLWKKNHNGSMVMVLIWEDACLDQIKNF